MAHHLTVIVYALYLFRNSLPSALPALAGSEGVDTHRLQTMINTEEEHLLQTFNTAFDTNPKLGSEKKSKLPDIRRRGVSFEISSELPPQ